VRPEAERGTRFRNQRAQGLSLDIAFGAHVAQLVMHERRSFRG